MLRLPLGELEYRASRSGGPGGQHVNTSSTRVELWWDVAQSPSLTELQRQRLLPGWRPGWTAVVGSGWSRAARGASSGIERK